MDCNNRENNKKHCTCKNTNCPLHGICCECMRRHKEGKTYPHCFDDAQCVTMKERIASFSPETLQKVKQQMKQNAVKQQQED